MTEVESYRETIEPELKVLTRLFGFPESEIDFPDWRVIFLSVTLFCPIANFV